MQHRFVKLTTLMLAILVWPAAAFCLTPPEVEKALRAKKIVSANVQIKSTVGPNEVHLSTVPEPNAKDTPERYKIDAVLMAKTIMDADKSIQRVFVRFYDPITVEQYTEVTVRFVDVKAFGAGLTTQDQLLDSLTLEKGTDFSARGLAKGGTSAVPPPPVTVAPIEVVDGPMKDERMKLGMRIQALKTKGVGVKPFLDQFNVVEELAKSTDSAATIGPKVEALTESVSDQEKVLAEHMRAAAKRTTTVAVKTSAPIPAVVSPAAPTSGSLSLSSLFGGNVSGNPMYNDWAAKSLAKHMGDPSLEAGPGPMRLGRQRMAWVISLRRSDGYGVDSFLSVWRECESLAAANREAELHAKLVTLARALKVADPVTDDAFYIELWMRQEHHEHEHGEHHEHDRH